MTPIYPHASSQDLPDLCTYPFKKDLACAWLSFSMGPPFATAVVRTSSACSTVPELVAFLRQPTSVERGCDLPNFCKLRRPEARNSQSSAKVETQSANVGHMLEWSTLCQGFYGIAMLSTCCLMLHRYSKSWGGKAKGASLVPAWLGWFLPKFSFCLVAFVVGSQSEPDLPSAFLLPPEAPHISMLMLNNAEDCTRHLAPLKVSFLPDFPSPWPVSVPRSHRLKVGLSPSPRCRGHGNSCSHCAGLAPSKNQLSQPRISAVFG